MATRKLITNRTTPLFGSFLVLCFILIGLWAAYFHNMIPFAKPTNINQNAFTTQNTTTLTFPIPLSNRNISNAYLAYNFWGPIKTIKQVSKGEEITLNTSEKSTPSFLITPQTTKVFTVKAGQIQPAEFSDLQPNQQVSISTTYDLKTKVWITRTVHIIQ